MTLHLTLKKKWFDMIASGEKKEEYREDKAYWRKRLIIPNSHPKVCKKVDLVKFTNGYGKSAPTLEILCEGVSINFGKSKWGGDENNLQFVIKLGDIISHY